MENSFELHRARRRLFATDAAGYDDGRPGYPTEVFDILIERCGSLTGSQVLEIGPGTGQATGPLLDGGAAVTAIELGAEMATRLAERHASRSLEVIVGPFEDIELPATRFDLVVAATSFHWVDPEVALSRCGEALKPDGWLALWWNYFGDPDRPDPFHEALQPLLQRHAPELIDTTDASAGAHPYALDTVARTAEIDATGLFGRVRRDAVAWTGEHTPAQIRRLFGSFSPFLALAPGRREPLLDEIEQLAADGFGGVVTRPYLTPIFTAPRG